MSRPSGSWEMSSAPLSTLPNLYLLSVNVLEHVTVGFDPCGPYFASGGTSVERYPQKGP